MVKTSTTARAASSGYGGVAGCNNVVGEFQAHQSRSGSYVDTNRELSVERVDRRRDVLKPAGDDMGQE